MKIEMVMVLINLFIMLASAAVLVSLIMRTEKGLDSAFKVLLIMPIVLVLTSLFQFDQLSGIFSPGYAKIVFYASRLVANLSFLIACWILLKTVSSECKKQ